MPLGQMQTQEWWTKVLQVMKFSARIPVAGLAIVATGLLSWLGFWLLVRASMYAFHRWLNHSWGP